MLPAAQHGCRITFGGFLPGRATSLLLSGDVRWAHTSCCAVLCGAVLCCVMC
jgi:hypothetical protein